MNKPLVLTAAQVSEYDWCQHHHLLLPKDFFVSTTLILLQFPGLCVL